MFVKNEVRMEIFQTCYFWSCDSLRLRPQLKMVFVVRNTLGIFTSHTYRRIISFLFFFFTIQTVLLHYCQLWFIVLRVPLKIHLIHNSKTSSLQKQYTANVFTNSWKCKMFITFTGKMGKHVRTQSQTHRTETLARSKHHRKFKFHDQIMTLYQ